MRKLALTLKLLYRIMVIGMLCIFANSGEVIAAENTVKVVQNGIFKDNLAMKLQTDELFSEKVEKFLNRGFTVRIEYNIELWQSRTYWFDSLKDQKNISYQISFDPVGKQYQCERSLDGSKFIEKSAKRLDNLARWIMNPDFYITFGLIDQLNQNDKYYYSIGVLVATLTAENVRDLRKWMGDFSDQEDQPSSISRAAIKVIMDFLSSRNHKRFSSKSEQFYIADLPKLEK